LAWDKVRFRGSEVELGLMGKRWHSITTTTTTTRAALRRVAIVLGMMGLST